ncbi:MAG: hypothetical protein JWN56_545 [Sphingobacteriales bacterium]|nr:hypothetical protein [Sphingobacteriales bacterium]
MKSLYQTDASLMKLGPDDVIISSRPIHESFINQQFVKIHKVDLKANRSIGFDIKSSKK